VLQILNGKNLKIFGLLSTDGGIYQCFASNPSGTVQTSARLTVANPSAVNVDPGKSYAHFVCTIYNAQKSDSRKTLR
jgi:hypothetical protein